MTLRALLRQFTIRTRMIGAIAMVLALLTMVGGVGLYGMQSLRKQATVFLEQTRVESELMTRLTADMGNLRRYEKDMIISYEKPDEVKAYRARWEAVRQSLADDVKKLAAAEGRRSAQIAAKLQPLIDGYAQKAAPVLDQLAAGAYDTATVANRLLAQAKAQSYEADKMVDELRVAVDHEAQASLKQAESTQDLVFLVFLLGLGFSAAVVVPLTLLNMTSICRPLVDAEALADAIAKGDLTSAATQIEGKDEASHLMRSLQHMQQSLQQLVGQLRTSADSIRTASVEIASGNQDLSARTEQTASNLQQAASSMVQLTGTVRQTADSAQTANQLVSSASSAANKGGQVVSQVVATMDEINTSSKKISDIIGVIDGIAFQTNILALNAAVEAARAGEQGRGFAVVAGEVRSLAQRSAEAAREIKTLISASVERVEIGARLVQDAGSSMNDIVSSVQRVSDIIGEISAASAEQSEGIGSINQSVVQLDQMTQQNAALVEQSAAAAESLKDQAEALALAVDKFRIDAKASLAPAPRPRPAVVATPAAPPAPQRAAAPTAASRSKSKPAASKPAPAKPLVSAGSDSDWESF